MRSRLRPWIAFGGLMAVAFAGCTLLEPLDGFSEPRDALDGALEGAVSDAPASEANADGNANADAGDAVAAIDAGPFCGRVDASFCEDFDDPVEASRWTLSAVRNASHGIDDATSTSPPSSLFAMTHGLDAGETAESYRRIDFPDRVTSVTYAFDLRIDQRAQQGFLIAAAGLNDKANTGYTYSASFILGDTQDTLEESSEGTPNTYNDHVLGARVPLGKWTRVSVSVQRQNTGSYVVMVALDGQPVVSEALTLWKNLTGGKPYITIGAAYVPGPTQPWSVRMDSLTVDTQ